MSTFISVIVPVYNTEKYLNRCIDSILNQTYKDFELILIDDGSTDSSGLLLDGYKDKDDRIIVIHKENGGSSSARNEAIKLAKGEYFSFIDSDDYIESDFLEKLVEPLERAKARGAIAPKIVQIGRDEINEDGSRRKDICVPPENETEYSGKAFFETLIMHIGDCSFCTKLTHRSLFNNREFPIGKLNEDFNLLIQMLFECDGVVSLPGYKYHVFYRLGSNSRKKDKNDFSRVYADNLENADFVEKLVDDNYPDLKEMATRFALFQRIDYMLHIPIAFMNSEYKGYKGCVSYIRVHFPGFLFNKYLTSKNKIYLLLFALAPKTVRKLHAKVKKL